VNRWLCRPRTPTSSPRRNGSHRRFLLLLALPCILHAPHPLLLALPCILHAPHPLLLAHTTPVALLFDLPLLRLPAVIHTITIFFVFIL
jgi:hypothetical protein